MSFRRLDEWCLAEAVRRAAMQPRCDYTFEQLPQTGTVSPTDLFCLERNGQNYAAPASAIPTQVVGTIGFFNVVTYGADPTGVKDSTAAITAAIAAAQAAGGGIVYFPQGTYLVSSTITIPANGISLMGAGPGAVKIQSAPTVIAPTVFQTAASVSYVTISQLGFLGNSVNPAPPPNAPTVIVFNGGVDNKVFNCYFTGNTGDCIDFLGVTDGEVWSCRFNGTGYNGAGSSNTLVTPAVYADSASVAIRVHHNAFQGCKYFGVLIMGTDCEVSYNYLKSTGNSGIRIGQVSSVGDGNNCRVCFNEVDTVTLNPVDSAGGTGIYAEGIVGGVYHGNIISTTDSDGIAFANCNNFICIGNVPYNCCQKTDQAGIQYNPQGAGVSTGAVFIGNVSFDNQATPTQLNGMRILGPGSGGTSYATIVGNSFPGFTGTVGGNAQRGINATDAILDGDTNIIVSNTDWLDRMHLGSAATSVGASITATGVGAPANSVMAAPNIERGVLGLNRALRLVTYGVVTVATGVTYYLSFGSAALGNIVTFAYTSVNTNVQWLLEVWMNNADNNNVQHFSYALWINGAIVAQGGGNLAVNTLNDNAITLQATTGSGDSITCKGFTVTRE